MMKTKKISELLNFFTKKDDLCTRNCFKNIFLKDGYVYGTDANSLARVPAERVDLREVKNQDCVDPTPLFDRKEIKPVDKRISVSALRRVLQEFPLLDEYETKRERHVCRECKGSGLVEWKYNGRTKLDKCPVCKGRGATFTEKKVKTGKRFPDPGALLMFGKFGMTFKQMQLLLQAADLMNAEHIHWTGLRANMIYFKIGEVELLFAGKPNDRLYYKDYKDSLGYETYAWKKISQIIVKQTETA